MGKIDLNRIKLSQLRALVAVADTRNFSHAAQRLSLSQSTISHAIATLENELGAILVKRGRQGATLTGVGNEIARDARQILELLGTIARKAGSARSLEVGELTVTCFRSIGAHILPEAIARFQQQYPGIRFQIDEHQLFKDVEEDIRIGRADLGFTYLPAGPEFETWELFRDDYLALLPAVPAPPDPLSWEDLARYPLILTQKQRGCHQLIVDHLLRHGQPVNIAYEVREDSTILGMVRRGLGATVMARLAAEPLPSQIAVRTLPAPLERSIGVAALAGALHPPAVFAFLDTLRQTIANRSETPPEPAAPATVAPPVGKMSQEIIVEVAS